MYEAFPDGSIAQSWFAQSMRANAFTDFDGFGQAFRARFELTVAAKLQLQRQLRTFKQIAFDNVSMYYGKFAELLSRLSGVGIEVQDEMRIHYFVQGLDKAVRERVYPDLIKDYEELSMDKVLSLAMTDESILPRPRPDYRADVRPDHVSVKELQAQLKAMSVDDRPCGFCKKPGHLFDDCPAVLRKKAAGKWVDKSARSDTFDE